MRVLLVDDQNLYSLPVQKELETEHGFEVRYVSNPLAARTALRNETFDVVVVDLLYLPLYQAFDRRRRTKAVSLSDETFLVSGLATLCDLANNGQEQGILIWTMGEENRALPMIFASQEFGVRAYCSKGPTANATADLARAIRAAHEGQAYVDPNLELYLPPRGLRPLGELFFETPKQRGIWRALALGVRSQPEIGAIAEYAWQSIRNEISQMAHKLAELDPSVNPEGRPFDELQAYATTNWTFFLDDTVIQMYPHKKSKDKLTRPRGKRQR